MQSRKEDHLKSLLFSDYLTLGFLGNLKSFLFEIMKTSAELSHDFYTATASL
jgi:hypothetical protein